MSNIIVIGLPARKCVLTLRVTGANASIFGSKRPLGFARKTIRKDDANPKLNDAPKPPTPRVESPSGASSGYGSHCPGTNGASLVPSVKRNWRLGCQPKEIRSEPKNLMPLACTLNIWPAAALAVATTTRRLVRGAPN